MNLQVASSTCWNCSCRKSRSTTRKTRWSNSNFRTAARLWTIYHRDPMYACGEQPPTPRAESHASWASAL